MAIVWVKELHQERRTRKATTGYVYTRAYLVLTNDIADGSQTVVDATGIPRLYDPHPDNLSAICDSIDAAPEQDDGNLWRVRIGYNTIQQAPAAPGAEDPLDQPKDLAWSFQPVTRIAEYGWNDQTNAFDIPIQNSAKMPFVPAPEFEDYLPVLEITRNEAAFSPALAVAYMGVTNLDTFYGTGPGLALFGGATANRLKWSDGSFYWRVTYRIVFQREGWDLRIADKGFYEIIGSTVDGKPIYAAIKQKDANGKTLNEPVTEPVYLNLAGGQAATGQVGKLTFKRKRLPFAPLNLE